MHHRTPELASHSPGPSTSSQTDVNLIKHTSEDVYNCVYLSDSESNYAYPLRTLQTPFQLLMPAINIETEV